MARNIGKFSEFQPKNLNSLVPTTWHGAPMTGSDRCRMLLTHKHLDLQHVPCRSYSLQTKVLNITHQWAHL